MYARRGDHVVYDPQQVFSLNEHVPRNQQIRMFGDGPSQSVFNWDDRGPNRTLLETIKHLRRPYTGDHPTARQHPLRSFMTEGTQLPLNGYFHGQSKLSGEAPWAQSHSLLVRSGFSITSASTPFE